MSSNRTVVRNVKNELQALGQRILGLQEWERERLDLICTLELRYGGCALCLGTST
ncbi:hypothetical protein LY78DRAFT_649869 [Colletotrichum sublineola]|nr:hypothetical protein LY78DRAFT_649869 [Colletotrichum sublineola]